MTDPPAPSTLGVEAIECLPGAEGNVTVRVTGRWRRRRRPDWNEPPVLVVEAEGRRHRFPAALEPPSLSGILAGTWRVSFSVPAELSAHLADRAWLQLGAAMSRLRVPVEPAPPAGQHADRGPAAPRALEPTETPADEGDAAAIELAETIQRLQPEREAAQTERERLEAALSESERRRRAAQQRGHAEAAVRAELQVERAQLDQEYKAALAQIGTLEERVRELERELRRLRRAADEAEHAVVVARAAQNRGEQAVVVARAAQNRAEQAVRARSAAPGRPPLAQQLRAELSLIRGRATLRLPIRAPASPARTSGDALAAEARMVARRATLPRDLAQQRQRSLRAFEALEKLREELAQLALRSPGPTAPQPAPIEAQRLTEALTRLREAAPRQPEPEAAEARPEHTAASWLRTAFRQLAAEDLDAAGRLLLALLPAQGAVAERRVAYDLVLGPTSAVRVTATTASAQVELSDAPRPQAEVDLRLKGDLRSIVRLLLAGRLRRRFGRGLPKLRGDRRMLKAIHRLIEAPFPLRELHELGVRLDPLLAFALTAAMIEPHWTKGEQFVVAHQLEGTSEPDAYLQIRDGRTPRATAGLRDEAATTTTLVCGADAVLPALAWGGQFFIRGEHRPLELLAGWLERAQSA